MTDKSVLPLKCQRLTAGIYIPIFVGTIVVESKLFWPYLWWQYICGIEVLLLNLLVKYCCKVKFVSRVNFEVNSITFLGIFAEGKLEKKITYVSVNTFLENKLT